MLQFKRLLWLFIAGFVTVLGGFLAAIVGTLTLETVKDSRRAENIAENYQPPKTGMLEMSEPQWIEIARSGGVRGIVTNRSDVKVTSFRLNLAFVRGDTTLFQCDETIVLDVEPGKSTPYQMICSQVERAALASDIKPRLRVIWVYPSK